MAEETGSLPAVDFSAWVQWKSLQEGDEQLPRKEQTYPGGRAPGARGWAGREARPAGAQRCQHRLQTPQKKGETAQSAPGRWKERLFIFVGSLGKEKKKK